MTFAAAIACQMVLKPSWRMVDHVKAACQYVEMGIRTGKDVKLGHGSGPINHFHNVSDQASLKVESIRT